MHEKILAIFAHPDDEAFGVGGTLARYAAEGHEVNLICATSGEEGLNRLDADDTAKLGELRREELRAACQALGIKPPVILDYRDSGMLGEPSNDDPACLHQADLDALAGEIREQIEALRPDILITFEQFGWYGHPDHVKVHRAVQQAHQQLDGDQPELFYAAFCTEATRYMAHVFEQRGEEIPDTYRDRTRLRYRLNALPIVVDTSPFAGQKIAALNAHRTQMGSEGVEGRFPPEILRARVDREYFMPAAFHDKLPEITPFTHTGGLFNEPAPVPLVPFPILPIEEVGE